MDIKINADLQPVLEATPKAIDRVFRLIFPEYTMRTERFVQLSQAQNSQDVKKIMQGDAYFDIEDRLLIEKYNSYNPIDFVKNIVADEEAMSFSEENIQEMWGRILAEKINETSSISLRALDILKNISNQDAYIFDEYCENIIFGDRIFEHYSSQIHKLDALAEIGLIFRTQGVSSGGNWPIQSLTNGQNIYYIIRNKNLFWIPTTEVKQDMGLFLLQNNILTSTGKILYNISSKNKEYDQEKFGKLLLKNTGILPHIYCSAIDSNGYADTSTPTIITK